MYYDSGRLRADGHSHIIYDGVDLNDYFEVTAIGFSALPSVETVTTTVPERAGEHFFSRRLGSRTGTLRLTAIADDRDPVNVIEKWAELSPLINKDEPRPLYLGGERYLNAMLTGDTSLEFLGERGTVELTFTAFDPYFHGKTHEVELASGTNTFRVLSHCETWPIIKIQGASAPLRVRNNATYDEVRIPSVGNLEITIDMQNMKTYSGSNFMPVDVMYTDFFPLKPAVVSEIWLSSGHGTLTYEELSL